MYLLLLRNPEYREHYPEDAALLKRLPGKLRRELHVYGECIEGGGKHPNNGVCLWFDEEKRQCKHYDLRPMTCREFEINSDGCREWREHYGVNA